MMKLKELCEKYDLSELAYEYLVKDVNATKEGMEFTVMRDWKNHEYYISKDSLEVKEIKNK